MEHSILFLIFSFQPKVFALKLRQPSSAGMDWPVLQTRQQQKSS